MIECLIHTQKCMSCYDTVDRLARESLKLEHASFVMISKTVLFMSHLHLQIFFEIYIF